MDRIVEGELTGRYAQVMIDDAFHSGQITSREQAALICLSC